MSWAVAVAEMAAKLVAAWWAGDMEADGHVAERPYQRSLESLAWVTPQNQMRSSFILPNNNSSHDEIKKSATGGTGVFGALTVGTVAAVAGLLRIMKCGRKVSLT